MRDFDRASSSTPPVAKAAWHSPRPRRRSFSLFLLLAALVLAALWPLKSAPAQTPPTASITVHAFECEAQSSVFPDPHCTRGAELDQFTFIVNVDNAHYASDGPDDRPSIAPTESNSPVVATGDQDRPDARPA